MIFLYSFAILIHPHQSHYCICAVHAIWLLHFPSTPIKNELIIITYELYIARTGNQLIPRSIMNIHLVYCTAQALYKMC